jgi:hypothetical protein
MTPTASLPIYNLPEVRAVNARFGRIPYMYPKLGLSDS